MTRILMLTMLITGIMTAPAKAAPRPAQEALPGVSAELLAAFEAVAAATDARIAGADADVELAEGLTRLAGAVADIPGEREFVAFIRLDQLIVGREISLRMSRGTQDTAPIVEEAFDRLQAAKADWILRHVNAGANGPDSQCFMNYANCMVWCSNLQGFVMRAACGLDCTVDFNDCMGVSDAIDSITGILSVFGKPRQPGR